MILDPTSFLDHRLRALHDYWRRHSLGGRPMPRARLDPVDLPRLLSNLMILEVPEDGGEPRFRLAGGEIEERYGRSLRGLRLSETFPLVRRYDTSHQWAEILLDARPKYRRGPMAFPEGRIFEAERLLLPLSDGGRRISHILGAICYLPLSPQAFEQVAVVGTLET